MNLNRTVLITGVSKGIGLATARHFLEKEWRVIGLDAIEPIEAHDDLEFILCNLAKINEMNDVTNWLLDNHIQLDAIVNNAGKQVIAKIADTLVEDWDEVMAVNLRSVFYLAKKLSKHMPPGSSIVNVSSVHALATSKEIGVYAASKGGLVALTRALALELADIPVRVNAVLPGAIHTDMLRDGLSREHVTGSGEGERLFELSSKVPLGRIGFPEEVAKAIYFLANEKTASYITGQTLIVDGGALAKLSTE